MYYVYFNNIQLLLFLFISNIIKDMPSNIPVLVAVCGWNSVNVVKQKHVIIYNNSNNDTLIVTLIYINICLNVG